MEGVCKLARRLEESTGSEETPGVSAAEQETGGATQTSPSSRLHLQGGEAEKEGRQEHPQTCYLLEKALRERLGGHQS